MLALAPFLFSALGVSPGSGFPGADSAHWIRPLLVQVTLAPGSDPGRLVRSDSADAFGSLAQVLGREVGMAVRTYGPNGVGSLSVAGSSPAQSAVVWRGFDLRNPMVAQTDLSLLPAFMLGSLHMQGLSAGVHQGGGALAGALVLGEHAALRQGWQTLVMGGVGSFGEAQAGFQHRQALGKAWLEAKAYRRTQTGDFPYRNPEQPGWPRLLMHNNRMTLSSASLEVGRFLGKRSELGFSGWFTQASRGIPPTFVQSLSEARQDDAQGRLVAWCKGESAAWIWQVQGGYWNDRIHYTDPQIRLSSATQAHTFLGKAWIQRHFLGDRVWVKILVDAQHTRAAGGGIPVGVVWQRRGIMLEAGTKPFSWMEATLSARQDASPGRRVPAVMQGRVELGHTATKLRLGAGSGFRFPGLNDWYWQPGGNPGLLPETSLSAEAGLKTSQPYGPVQAEHDLSLTLRRVENWIQWIPIGGYWQPQNLGLVEASCVETRHSLRCSPKPGILHLTLDLQASYTRAYNTKPRFSGDQTVGAQLMLVPFWQSLVRGQVQYRNLSIRPALRYLGMRYADAANQAALSGVWLLDAEVAFSLKLPRNQRLRMALWAENLSGQAYQLVPQRPMPLQSFSLQITWLISALTSSKTTS